MYTGAKLNFGHIVLGEVEMDSFIALPGKDGHSRLLPSKLCVPALEDLVKSFIVIVRVGLLIRLVFV